jgi:hypothetical protein
MCNEISIISAIFDIWRVRNPFADSKSSSPGTDEMYNPNTRARMESQAPRPVQTCKSARYPDAKFRSESTDMKFNSSRCDEKLRGNIKPFLLETRLKDVMNAEERSNLLILSGEIYIGPDQCIQWVTILVKRFTDILEEMRNPRDD